MCNCKCGNKLSFKSWLGEDVWTDKDNDHLGEPGNIQQMKSFLTTGLSAQEALGAQKNLGKRQELIRALTEKFGVDEKIAGQAVSAWIATTLGL
jgi:hypothetical protein